MDIGKGIKKHSKREEWTGYNNFYYSFLFENHNNISLCLDEFKELYENCKVVKLTCLFDILDVMLEQYQNENEVETTWIRDAIRSEIRSDRVKSEQRRINLGILAYYLWKLGCSQRQVILFLSDWFIESETKVRDAFYDIKKNSELITVYPSSIPKLDIFVSEHLKEKATPEDYPDAKRALERFLEMTKEWNKGLALLKNTMDSYKGSKVPESIQSEFRESNKKFSDTYDKIFSE